LFHSFLFHCFIQFYFHQDDAFAAVTFDIVTDEAKLDIIQYHVSASELSMECGSLTEMAYGKDTRTLCNDDGEPVFQKGAANSRAALPQFDPTAGIAVCGGATVYVIDRVLIPGDYEDAEDSEVVMEPPASNVGMDIFKELLSAKGTVVQGSNTCADTNPQFPNIACLGEDGTVDVGPQGTSVYYIRYLYITVIYTVMQCYTITYLHTSFTFRLLRTTYPESKSKSESTLSFVSSSHHAFFSLPSVRPFILFLINQPINKTKSNFIKYNDSRYECY
jgi:hypothetical protein